MGIRVKSVDRGIFPDMSMKLEHPPEDLAAQPRRFVQAITDADVFVASVLEKLAAKRYVRVFSDLAERNGP